MPWGLKSKSGVHRLNHRSRGGAASSAACPHRGPGPSRSPRLSDDQISRAEPAGRARRSREHTARIFSANVIHGDFTPSIPGARRGRRGPETVQLPALRQDCRRHADRGFGANHSNAIDIPASMLGRGEHYALTVEGDSIDRSRHPLTATPS